MKKITEKDRYKLFLRSTVTIIKLQTTNIYCFIKVV